MTVIGLDVDNAVFHCCVEAREGVAAVSIVKTKSDLPIDWHVTVGENCSIKRLFHTLEKENCGVVEV